MRKLSRTAVALVALISLAIPVGAKAQTTIGQLAPTTPLLGCSGPGLFWQTALASGLGYVVPSSGAITSWSTAAADGAGRTLTLKVLRPLVGGQFLVIGHDGPRTLAPSKVNTFETSIPVQANDILALNTESSDSTLNGACSFIAASGAADVLSEAQGSPADGTPFGLSSSINGFRLDVSATLVSPPTLTAVSPTSGPIKGGSAVTIAGSNFAAVKSVTFGGISAASFKVDSESQITAVAPAGKTVSQTPVVVTTAAGSATGTFTYVRSAPSITAISPTSGSVKGGSTVTIAGSEFAEVKSVTFGGTAAESFGVNSESQVTAIAPAGKTLTSAQVVVTTAAGSATGTFSYEGCRVPKLSGLGLKSAKKRLRKANCKLGKARKLGGGVIGKTDAVVRQNPKPRKVLAPGTKVNLTFGRV